MAEFHNNTRPATTGFFAINATGIISSFPIEEAKALRPAYDLVLYEKLDGELVAVIETRNSESIIHTGLQDE